MANFNLADIRSRLTNILDVQYRDIRCDKEDITLVYVDNLSDKHLISEFIIAPLLNYKGPIESIEKIKQEIIILSPAEEVDQLDKAITHILSGDVLLFFSSFNEIIYCDAKGFTKRSLEESNSETAIKGPRAGLTESIQDNLSTIRRRLGTPDLKVTGFKVGKKSKTAVKMLYIENIAPKELVEYITIKINSLQSMDYVLYPNHLEEELKCRKTAFDTIGYTEKADVAAQNISEGKVVVLFDGSPFAIIAPYFFLENFHTVDDYTMNNYMANIGRALRLLAFILSTLLPSLYLALVTYHFKLIPSIFLFRMAVTRAGVPVPTVIELLTMIIFFQFLREASVRLPQPIGSTLSIVGALILGDAAIGSGLTSQVTVVVVGITSICSYLIPKVYIAIFTWNTILILFSASLGLPGFYIGFSVFVAHLANLTTCGYPYLYPLGTRETLKYKDVTYRGKLTEISNSILTKEGEQ